MRDPHMRLKRKRLGLAVDLREGRRMRALERVAEAEERDEEEEETPLIQLEKKTAAPRKRKQAAPGSMSTPERTKVCSYKVLIFPSLILDAVEWAC